ncbi:MAG: hypothetical protein ABIG66_04990 [Candidatus Kerfeldbacteria bacterium]
MNRWIVGIALVFFVCLPSAVHAERDWYSTKIPKHVLENHDVSVKWKDVQLTIPAGSLNADTRVRLRDRGPYGSRPEMPSIPKRWRSKRIVYSYWFSNQPNQPIPVALKYRSGDKDRRHRVMYLKADTDKWVKLHTIVDKNVLLLNAVLPAQSGKIIAVTHKWKKEVPVRSVAYNPYYLPPHSDTAAVIDEKSGKFLFRKDAKKQRSIASLTKLATTLVFLESKPDLNKEVQYRSACDRIGATVPLHGGDVLTLKQVLMGVLMKSANNMAIMLSAEASWPEQDLFVTQMNNRMAEMNLKKTSFVEPSGLNSHNVSSAGNVAQLARTVFDAYPDLFSEAASTGVYTFDLANSDREISLYTTNKFEGNGKYELLAFKTGYLPGSADRTLVTKIIEKETGHTIIVVLLGNPEYNTIFQEAYALADWTFANWVFHNY